MHRILPACLQQQLHPLFHKAMVAIMSCLGDIITPVALYIMHTIIMTIIICSDTAHVHLLEEGRKKKRKERSGWWYESKTQSQETERPTEKIEIKINFFLFFCMIFLNLQNVLIR